MKFIEPGTDEWDRCKQLALSEIGFLTVRLLAAEEILERAEEKVELAAARLAT